MGSKTAEMDNVSLKDEKLEAGIDKSEDTAESENKKDAETEKNKNGQNEKENEKEEIKEASEKNSNEEKENTIKKRSRRNKKSIKHAVSENKNRRKSDEEIKNSDIRNVKEKFKAKKEELKNFAKSDKGKKLVTATAFLLTITLSFSAGHYVGKNEKLAAGIEKTELAIREINTENYPEITINFDIINNGQAVDDLQQNNIVLSEKNGDNITEQKIESFSKTDENGYVIVYKSDEADNIYESGETKLINISVNSEKYKAEKEEEYKIETEDYGSYEDLCSNINELVKNNFESNSGINEYSFYFKDLSKEDAVSINNKEMLSASTIKVYVMIEAFQQMKDGELNPQEMLTLLQKNKKSGAGSLAYSKSGTKYSVMDVLDHMIRESDNTATDMMIDRLTAEKINERIKALGCQNTELKRPFSKLKPEDNNNTNFTSVEDLGLVLEKMYRGECVDEESDKKMIELLKTAENNVKICRYIDKLEGITIAHKTGEINEAQNDAGIIFIDDEEKNIHRAYIVCFMTKHGAGAVEMETIADTSKEILELCYPYMTGSELENVPNNSYTDVYIETDGIDEENPLDESNISGNSDTTAVSQSSSQGKRNKKNK